MYPHPIRLREPWSREPLGESGLRLRRGFHRPTITAGERVWMVCDGLNADAVASFDGRLLGTIAASEQAWSHDVTELLVGRHELTFDFAAMLPVDRLPWREVRLEVRLAR